MRAQQVKYASTDGLRLARQAQNAHPLDGNSPVEIYIYCGALPGQILA